jgi:hypothetical protein
MRVWQVLAIPANKAPVDDAFFINTPMRLPQDYYLVALLSAVVTPGGKEAMAELLGKGNGGGNCFMDLPKKTNDLAQTLHNRKEAFLTEFRYTDAEKKNRINLKGAQFM